MVTLGFVIDLPRLSAWSVDDVTKFLKEVAAKFVFSIMLDEPADKISVFYITKTPQVMNVAYKAGSGNFRGNVFEKAVKNLPTVPKEMGSELTSDGT